MNLSFLFELSNFVMNYPSWLEKTNHGNTIHYLVYRINYFRTQYGSSVLLIRVYSSLHKDAHYCLMLLIIMIISFILFLPL